MYIVETDSGGGFTNIPESVYWAIVTMTTVGYGDIAPVTVLGKFIASFVMILGYGIIAVPTGIVGVVPGGLPEGGEGVPGYGDGIPGVGLRTTGIDGRLGNPG